MEDLLFDLPFGFERLSFVMFYYMIFPRHLRVVDPGFPRCGRLNHAYLETAWS